MLFLAGLDLCRFYPLCVFLIWKIRVLARVSGFLGGTEISFCALCEAGDSHYCLSHLLPCSPCPRCCLPWAPSLVGRAMHSRQ